MHHSSVCVCVFGTNVKIYLYIQLEWKVGIGRSEHSQFLLIVAVCWSTINSYPSSFSLTFNSYIGSQKYTYNRHLIVDEFVCVCVLCALKCTKRVNCFRQIKRRETFHQLMMSKSSSGGNIHYKISIVLLYI